MAIELKGGSGTRLIKLLSCPRNPTKTNPRKRLHPADSPELFGDFYAYNVQDIKAEGSVSRVIPDLSPPELEVWQLDQQINARGVQVDTKGLNDCLVVLRKVTIKYTEELKHIVGISDITIDKLDQIKKWMVGRGVNTPSLDADHVKALIKREDIPADVRKVLEIRQVLGSASVKKVYALERYVCSDGRIRGLYLYCGARQTGRFAGRGPQPQNIPSGGPDVYQCPECNKYYWAGLKNQCPHCWAPVPADAEPADWGVEAAQTALLDISTQDIDYIESRWGNVIKAVSGCLRALFVAAPGHELICSDYSAIEAVVLAALAGENWRLEVFRTHGKIYEMSASKISGVPFDEFLSYKKRTKQHHPLRKKIGKVAELACFTHDTQVLTNIGYVGIVDIKQTDKLWDGVEWVSHSGVILKGKKRVINLDGIKVTPGHPISLGRFWREAKQLASNKNMLTRALAIGSQNLPLLAAKKEINKGELLFNARAALTPTLYYFQTYLGVDLRGVINALRKNPVKHMLRCTLNARISYPTLNTVGGWLTDYVRPLQGVMLQLTNNTLTTGAGEYSYVTTGENAPEISSSMLLPSQGGTRRLWRWIEKTITKVMNLGISNLLLNQKTTSISELSYNFKSESMNLKNVYDIVNAGPRNRFTIKTNSGHLIVHNSGYAGWINAWKNFGADKFMDDDEIKMNILAWRAESPNIVEFWGGQWRKHPTFWEFTPELHGIEGAAVMAIMNPGQSYTFRGITYGVIKDVLYCKLPSGRHLVYHKPRLTPAMSRFGKPIYKITFEGWNSDSTKGPIGWMIRETFGGRLVENIVQAVARDIFVYGMLMLAKAGYPIVLHTHDEMAAEVPHGWGSIEEVERLMGTMAEWCKDWPIKAAGGWRGPRYRK